MHRRSVKKTDTANPSQNNTIKFSPPFASGVIKLKSTLKAVPPFAEMASFFAWLRALSFGKRSAEVIPFRYESPNAIPPKQRCLWEGQ